MEPKFTVRDCSLIVWVANGVIHAMDCVVMCVRPGSAEKYGFTKLTENLGLIGTVTEGFTVPETVIKKIIFVKVCVWSSDSSGIALV